jgi:hypothetical protein
MQSTSYIEQSIFLQSGDYQLSFFYYSRNDTQNNPINFSIDGVLISTLSKRVSTWTEYKQGFTIPIDKSVLIRLEGVSTTNTTTGIDEIKLIKN